MEITEVTIRKTLALELPANDAEAKTVREYLVTLLHEVWLHEEGFDGKRPFGNSGWQYEVYKPMIAAGLVNGLLDHDGFIEQFDEYQAEKIIIAAIDSMRKTPQSPRTVL